MHSFVVVFIVVPFSGLLLLIWLITKSRTVGGFLLFMWLGIFGLAGLAMIIHPFVSRKELTRDDVYGQYIIDRTKFPGRQANWQYDHFRFEITKANEFIFYQTDKGRVIKTYRGKVGFLDAYAEPRIVISVDSPTHHIINEKPTLYREIWSFYYVFNSPEFGNVFFRKGSWK